MRRTVFRRGTVEDSAYYVCYRRTPVRQVMVIGDVPLVLMIAINVLLTALRSVMANSIS